MTRRLSTPRVRRLLVALGGTVCFIALAKPAAAQWEISPLNIQAEFSCSDELSQWTCAYTAFMYTTTPTMIYVYAFTQLSQAQVDDYEGAVVETELSDNLGELGAWEGYDDDTGTPGLAEIKIAWSPYVIPEDYKLYSEHCINECDDSPGDTILGTTFPTMYAAAPQITGVTPVFIGSSSGNITVSGSNLVDAFYLFNGLAGNQPAVGSPPGWTATFAGYDSNTGDVTLGYANIPATVPRGTQNLSLTSQHFGASVGQILVGDHSPVISNVTSSPTIWQAGGTATVTVTGTYLGLNPQVSITLLNPNDNGCNGPCVGPPVITGSTPNTQITFTVTIGANEPGNTAWVSVTSNGYNANPPGFLGLQPSTVQYGTAIAIKPIPATPPVISYFGTTITQNQQVYVGQQIQLSASGIVVPNGLSLVTTTWTIQGAAIAGYAANTTSGQVTALTNPITGTVVTYYWTNPSVAAGCQNSPLCSVSFTYVLSNNQRGSATVTFNVGAPTSVTVATSVSIVGIVNPPTTYTPLPDAPLLEDGGGFGPGMQFTARSTFPQNNQGQYQWVQLINSDFSQYMQKAGPGPLTNAINGNPELDTTYPYGTQPYCTPESTVSTTFVPCDTAEDSPLTPLIVQQGEYSRSFNATMYLEWVPVADGICSANNHGNNPCTIPAPLGSITWRWGGDAIDTLVQEVDSNNVPYQQWVVNTSQVNSTCPSPNCAVPQPFQAGGPLPTWQNTINE